MGDPLPLVMQPGVYKEASEYAAKGRWTDAKNVRWWKGFPELFGGWSKLSDTALDTAPRGVHAWRALDGSLYMAFGTQNKLWLYEGSSGEFYDITPVDLPAGDGSAEEDIGPWDDPDTGYGDLPYGGAAPTLLQTGGARTWSLTNFGEDLVANYFGGPIYVWDKSTSAADPEANPAVVNSNAPATATGIFMSKARHLVAIGAYDGTSDDYLNIRWAARENLNNWAAGATSTAGANRVEQGGKLLKEIPTRYGHLLLTDFSAHLFRWIGSPNHFSLDDMGTNCGILGPLAGAPYGGIAYWMGWDGFFMFDGAVQRIPCDVQDFVYRALNQAEVSKIACGVNKKFDEIIWFYPSSTTENTLYVTYNTTEQHWGIGEIPRTCWIDSNVVTNKPIACDESGVVYVHEDGALGDGSPIPYYMESNEIEFENGKHFLHVRKMIPDFDRASGDHKVYLIARTYPQRAGEVTKGPYLVNGNTGKKSVRARGRSLRMRQESGDGDTDFRWGQWRFDGTLHGERS